MRRKERKLRYLCVRGEIEAQGGRGGSCAEGWKKKCRSVSI